MNYLLLFLVILVFSLYLGAYIATILKDKGK